MFTLSFFRVFYMTRLSGVGSGIIQTLVGSGIRQTLVGSGIRQTLVGSGIRQTLVCNHD